MLGWLQKARVRLRPPPPQMDVIDQYQTTSYVVDVLSVDNIFRLTMEEYDEDLTCNPFLIFFKQKHRLLYEEAIRKQWVLCIPSAVGLCDRQFDEKYIKQHIICQDGDTSQTLNNETVWIESNVLKFEAASVKILFRETLYTDLGKLSALCINQPDNVSSAFYKSTSFPFKLPSKSQKRNIRETVKKIRHNVFLYTKSDDNFSDQSKLEECVSSIQSTISVLDAKVQSCVIYNLYDQLMDLVTVMLSREDQQLNKTRMNLNQQEDKVLKLPQEFLPCLHKAQIEFDNIKRNKVISQKLNALKLTVKQLTETDTPAELSADSLLTLFSHLVINSTITNFYAQLYVMNHFHTSVKYGEESYYLSTLEATYDHLKSYSVPLCGDAESTVEETDLFHLARKGDATALEELFCSRKFKCHPLCTCHLCGIPTIVNGTYPDSQGWTGLHYTCMCGHTEATEVLLRTVFRDNVGKKDLNGRTALHWAAYQGFQTCLLLVCHQKCNLNETDCDGNTALHLSVLNGHESCVKALLYYAEQAHFKLEVNATNKEGDTPLHLAARWGYSSIVNLLLQWDADVTVENNSTHTPIQVAQNLKLSQVITLYNEQVAANG